MKKKSSESVMKFIGERIKEYRLSLGLSQEDLSQITSLTRASIVNIESGRQRITIDMFYFICQILKRYPNDLFPEVKPIDMSVNEEEIEVHYTKKIKRKSFSFNEPGNDTPDNV